MIYPRRWDDNINSKTIVDCVLPSQMADLDKVLPQMAKIYLAIGGDPTVSWEDTTSKMDILRDLEKRINVHFSCLERSSTIFHDVHHCYGARGGTPYGMHAMYQIEYTSTLGLEFIQDIKDMRLRRLLLAVLKLIIYNPVIQPITTTELADMHLPAVEEGEEGEETGLVEEIIEELKEFQLLFPTPACTIPKNRIGRLVKIMDSIHGLSEAQTNWLNDALGFLTHVYDETVRESFWKGIKKYDPYLGVEDEDDSSEMFTPDEMFIVTMRYGELFEIHCESVDYNFNNGMLFPCLKMDIKNKVDLENFVSHVGVLNQLSNLLEGGNGIWSST